MQFLHYLLGMFLVGLGDLLGSSQADPRGVACGRGAFGPFLGLFALPLASLLGGVGGIGVFTRITFGEISFRKNSFVH